MESSESIDSPVEKLWQPFMDGRNRLNSIYNEIPPNHGLTSKQLFLSSPELCYTTSGILNVDSKDHIGQAASPQDANFNSCQQKYCNIQGGEDTNFGIDVFNEQDDDMVSCLSPQKFFINQDQSSSALGQGFTTRQQRLQSLVQRMGIDGLAMCAPEGDFTLGNELNFDILTKQQEPWYNCLKEKHIENLFNEQAQTGFQKQEDFETYKSFTKIFKQTDKKKRKRTQSDSSQEDAKHSKTQNLDLFQRFQQSIEEHTNLDQFLTSINVDLSFNPDSQTISENLIKSFQKAQNDVRVGESPLRQILRFGLNLAQYYFEEWQQMFTEKDTTLTNDNNIPSAQSLSVIRDTLSERISDTLSASQNNSVSTGLVRGHLQKRKRDTKADDESRLLKKLIICEKLQKCSLDQIRALDCQCSQNSLTWSAPSPASVYFPEKIPRAKDLLLECLDQLPFKQGTKEQILNIASLICPQANKTLNPKFYKTLEQSLTKYLVVMPRMVKMTQEGIESLNWVSNTPEADQLKFKVLKYLSSVPSNVCEIQDLGRFGTTNSIMHLITRNKRIFIEYPKVYRIQENDHMLPPDIPTLKQPQNSVQNQL